MELSRKIIRNAIALPAQRRCRSGQKRLHCWPKRRRGARLGTGIRTACIELTASCFVLLWLRTCPHVTGGTQSALRSHLIKFEVTMKLSIRTRSVEITDALRDLISRRLRSSLDAFGGRVTNASVYLADVNGPRGGVDKSCQIGVAVRGIGDILVKRHD